MQDRRKELWNLKPQQRGAVPEAVHSLSEKVSNGRTIDPIVRSAETLLTQGPEEAHFISTKRPYFGHLRNRPGVPFL